jgi:aryl-phospho-beta-D-glucosidase BglC (GH1 family)
MKVFLAVGILTAFTSACTSSTSPRVQATAPTAAEINREMKTGFNLGNAFDLGLQSTKISDVAPLIDLYWAAGMRHIRIPVTWGNDVKGNKLMDSEGRLNTSNPRLGELDQVIDYALNKGMVVIINTHHEHWLKRNYDNTDQYNVPFTNLWKGIANRYKSHSPRLIFEVLNEPEGAFGDWSGTVSPFDPKAIALTRKINELGVAAIRSVSPTRVVMVGTNGQGNHSLLDDVYPTASSLPGGGSDKYLMATVHTYDPWAFCGEDGKNSNWPGERAITTPVRAVAAHGQKLGIPVNYGEFGVGRRSLQSERNTNVVRNFYRLIKQTAESTGMSATPWDDQGWFGLVSRDGAGKYSFSHIIVPSMMRNKP